MNHPALNDAESPYQTLLNELLSLRADAVSLEQKTADQLAQCLTEQRASAANLLHYLSVRQKDIRPLQLELSRLGLSSITAIEPHTLAALDTVISTLQHLTINQPASPPTPLDLSSGSLSLQQHARELLGDEPPNRHVRIMVTMPSEAATRPQLIEQLLSAGMNVMRINCAHDDVSAWTMMIKHLRQAMVKTGHQCKVQIDLAGPKLRTGSIAAEGHVIKLRPNRDLYGHITAPAQLKLAAATQPGGERVLQIDDALFQQLKENDELHCVDTRGQHRKLMVRSGEENGLVVQARQTTYIGEQTEFFLLRKGRQLGSGFARHIPPVIKPLLLSRGDHLNLLRNDEAGRPPVTPATDQQEMQPARIHCTLAQVFDQVQTGQRVWFDDGKIGGIVRANNGQEIDVEIVHTAPGGGKLGAEKGINLPDTSLDIPALTEKDRQALKQMVPLVDIVAMSFVRQNSDIEQLHNELEALKAPHVGVILKIENRQAFENLPQLLLTGLRYHHPLGVMVARGDLAVEMGFERLAEVQQEILWLCEAAHVPVVWATQILESMAKKGLPSRAEVSDAAMSNLAECAMLNKGPYIVETVTMLSDIIGRMDQHYSKRRATLRRLAVAQIDLPK